ncbi:MAG: DUF3307 domain-containing protein [Dysgonamonadaceae bacterium]|jgi:hypothetical protein|nr:DUF3307 domain-containing protein [Dysgonamonadaceae bacterium]
MHTLLILQFTAHTLADFNFQPQTWCDVKNSKKISKVYFYHIAVVFVCSWVLSFSVSFWWAALLIAAFHFLLDVTKSYLFRKGIAENYLFFIDQILHLLIITGVVYLFSKKALIQYPPFISINPVFILFAVIASSKPSNIFIKKYMEANNIVIAKKEKDNEQLLKAGRVIGFLERVLSFILISFDQFAAVGFIIAAKSILRFKDSDTAQTEYLLIGSFLSFGIAILLGIAYSELILFISICQI